MNKYLVAIEADIFVVGLHNFTLSYVTVSADSSEVAVQLAQKACPVGHVAKLFSKI